MITTKYYLISYDTSYFSREQFIKNAEEEYQEELENISSDGGYNTLEEAKAKASDNEVVYEVRWQNGAIMDYDILEERRF